MMDLMPEDETHPQTRTSTRTRSPHTGTATASAMDSPAPQTAQTTSGPAPWVLRLVAVGLVLTALNLRPAITSLGALLEEVRTGCT